MAEGRVGAVSEDNIVRPSKFMARIKSAIGFKVEPYMYLDVDTVIHCVMSSPLYREWQENRKDCDWLRCRFDISDGCVIGAHLTRFKKDEDITA